MRNTISLVYPGGDLFFNYWKFFWDFDFIPALDDIALEDLVYELKFPSSESELSSVPWRAFLSLWGPDPWYVDD